MTNAQAPARTCAGCTMCCKLLVIEALDKPRGKWCPNCAPERGCNIYPDRPEECRTFYCAYIFDPKLPEVWAPKDSKMVVLAEETNISVFVDESRRGAWRKEPFYSGIKRWSRVITPQGRQVLVFEGQEVIAVLPDREKALGVVAAKPTFRLTRTNGPQGEVFDIVVVPSSTGPVSP